MLVLLLLALHFQFLLIYNGPTLIISSKTLVTGDFYFSHSKDISAGTFKLKTFPSGKQPFNSHEG